MQRLYAYAADSDLSAVEAVAVGAFKKFASAWGIESVRLRNVKAPPNPGHEGALPDWNIGLSVEADQITPEQVEQLVLFLISTAKQCGREFVVGTWSARTSATEDLCFVNASTSRETALSLLEELRAHPWSKEARREP
jgi:hypothetical protein